MHNKINIAFKLCRWLILPACFFSCGEEITEKKLAAKTFSKELTVEELNSKIPSNLTEEEVIAFKENYINSWIEKQTIIHLAEKNISDKEEIDKLVEAYRNELLTYNYEKLLVTKQLDTAVSDEEIEQYYSVNKKDFELDDYLVQAIFVKIDKTIPDANQVKSWYKKEDDTLAIKELEEYAKVNAENFYYDSTSWIYFDELQKLLPQNSIYDKKSFVIYKRNQKFEDDQYFYFLNVIDYRFGISPLDFEQENIKNRIIQMRTNDIRKKLKEQLLDEAYNNNHVKIY